MTHDHIDLFSGIGGFALAARWAGFETVQFVEIDKFCQKVLNKNFPGVPIHDDIKTFHWTEASPFILTGGFPCQPFSCAGKRRGKEDDRFLWPEMLRVISEARPTWVIGENVAGFINMGLDDCISDLENQGYEVQTFIIPACAVNAPHRRDRVWIVAHTSTAGTGSESGEITDERRGTGEGRRESIRQGNGKTCPSGTASTDSHTADTARELPHRNGNTRRGRQEYTDGNITTSDTESQQAQPTEQGRLHAEPCGAYSDVTDTDRRHEPPRGKWVSGVKAAGGNGEAAKFGPQNENSWREPWIEVATRLCRMDARVSNRVGRLKSLGNAIVPQVAFQIMKAIRATV